MIQATGISGYVYRRILLHGYLMLSGVHSGTHCVQEFLFYVVFGILYAVQKYCNVVRYFSV